MANRFTLTSYDPVYVTAPEVRIPEEEVEKMAVRWLKANVCKEGEEPKLTDAWVKAHVEDIPNVEGLMAFIRFNMYKDNREAQKLADQDVICRELSTRLVGEIPENILEESIYAARMRFDEMIRRNGMTLDDFLADRGITEEKLYQDLEDRAVQSLREDSALEAYADKMNYTLEPEDFYAAIPGDSIEDKAHKRRQIEMEGRLPGLEQYALKIKALNEIMDNAMIRRSDDVEYVRYGDISEEVVSEYNQHPDNFITM